MPGNTSNLCGLPLVRVRPRPILTGLAWLVCCFFTLSAWAGRPVRVYDVTVKGGQSAASIQDAMREALVRATGRRESATDPAFAALISQAQNYVKAYVPGTHGETQVIFDGAAVERAIVAAGRNAWDQDRPFTLVILYPPLSRATEDAARIELEQTAMRRGLPITLLPLSPVDAAGNDIGRDGLMQLAQRYGGDAVLVGRGEAGAAANMSDPANAQWQWTLYTSFSSDSWSGALSAGIDGTVDNLAAPQGASLSQTETNVRIEIERVAALADYAAVGRLLESIPGVRRTGVIEVDGSTAIFDVLVRGGADTVSHALSGAAHLVRPDTSGTQLVYQYRP